MQSGVKTVLFSHKTVKTDVTELTKEEQAIIIKEKYIYLVLDSFPFIISQGCALRVPRSLSRLTFAFGQPDNLISFI